MPWSREVPRSRSCRVRGPSEAIAPCRLALPRLAQAARCLTRSIFCRAPGHDRSDRGAVDVAPCHWRFKVAFQFWISTFTGAGKGIKRDFESPTELVPGDHESWVQIAGPQPPISKTLEFSVDLSRHAARVGFEPAPLGA